MSATSRTLHLAVTSNITSLDPIAQDNVTASSIILQIYEGLFGYGPSGRIEPRLVSEWTISPDGRIYSFTLKPNVRFSNGVILTPAHVKSSFERLASVQSMNAWALDIIEGGRAFRNGALPDVPGISILNGSQFQIQLVEPFPSFVSLLASAYYRVVVPVDSTAGDHCPASCGTGPYVCVHVDPARGVTLSANPYYHGTRNNIDRIDYRVMPYAASTQAFNEGAIDLLRYYDDTVPVTRSDAREMLGYQFSTWYVGFNTERSPANDVDFRRAVAAAIDPSRLAAIPSRVRTATGFLPDGFLVDRADVEMGPAVSTPAPMGRLPRRWAEKPVDVLLSSSTPKAKQIADTLSDSLKTLGVDVRVAIESFGEFYRRRRAGEFTIIYANIMPDYGDPDAMVYPYFFSGSPGNVTRHRDAGLDTLILAARHELDAAKRSQLYARVNRCLSENAYIIPIYHDPVTVLFDAALDVPPISGLGPWFVEYNNVRWSEGMRP